MPRIPISHEDAEIVREYIAKNLQWLRRYEGDRPGVIDLVDDIQAAIDRVEINVVEDKESVEATGT